MANKKMGVNSVNKFSNSAKCLLSVVSVQHWSVLSSSVISLNWTLDLTPEIANTSVPISRCQLAELAMFTEVAITSN